MAGTTAPQGLDQLFAAHLEAGGSIVTATRRQARLIRSRYDRRQLAAGRSVWRSADVAPLSAWAAERWAEAGERCGALPLLLAEHQAAWPWRARAAFAGDSLIEPTALAAAARRAWVALRRHGGRVDELGASGANRDQRSFGAWAEAVERDLDAAGWLDPGCLEQALAQHAGLLEPGPALLLAGFREVPLALRKLVAALIAHGWQARFAPMAGPPGRCLSVAAADPAAEIGSLLAWLRVRLVDRPDGRFAVFIADLAARRAALERAFESALQPELELPGATGRDRLFDFAGGPALANLRVVDSALACLDAAGGRLDLGLASRLLRSPSAGRLEEMESRIRLDVALRAAGAGSWSIDALATRARDARCVAFAASLERAAQVLRAPGRMAAADVWATAFGTALAAWEWPGGRPLDSDEYQAAEALRERLGEFAALAAMAPAMGRAEARIELGRLAQAPFQPERGEAAVIVYDTLDAPGVGCDGLWAAGVTAADWPRAAAPDPFVPLALQSRLGMPGAGAAATLAEAIAVTTAWVGSAPEVVFSWPLRRDDAVAEASRVLPAATEPLALPPAAGSRARAAFESRALIAGPDFPPPPAAAASVRGGSRILELQARCPFRAFAELRLGARALEEPRAGVDPRSRGLVLHRALELLTGWLPDSAALQAADESARSAAIERALDRALAEQLPADLGDSLRELEREWQRAAIGRFLELESGREPFEVLATEQQLERDFAGLPLRLRVDRVDRVKEGLLVIDYKTGSASTTSWRGARPDGPQLPLYAVLRGADVCGVAFVSIGSQRAQYRGVAATPELLPGVEAAGRFRLTEELQSGFDWTGIRERWAAWLAALAGDFLAGDARVDPKRPQTCRHCHLGTLCRVSAAPGREAEEADDD